MAHASTNRTNGALGVAFARVGCVVCVVAAIGCAQQTAKAPSELAPFAAGDSPPKGVAWWCFKDETNHGSSYCVRNHDDCNDFRDGLGEVLSTRGETKLSACVLESQASCFAYLDKASGQRLVECHETVEHCLEARLFRKTKPADYADFSDCSAWK